jgi:LCP family protein required for cell wall assembly
MSDDEAPVRHALQPGRSPFAAAAKLLAVGLAVVVASAASIGAYGAWRIGSEFKDGSVNIDNGAAPSIGAIDGAFNVLLVGADNAPGQKSFGGSRDTTLNDVNILVHIAADHQSGTIISLPRDLVIPHPQCTDPGTGAVFPAMAAQPLNTAYARGGLGCVVGTVESVTGLTIPYASLFSFEGTVKMADAVGGVPVCVTKAIDDPDSGLKLPKGRSVISGRTALAYLRSRHGVGDGSDLSRIASQQAYMSSLLRTMTSANTLTDPTKLYGLAQAAAKNVTLSTSLANPDTIVQMALALKGMNLSDLVFVQYPTGEDPENPNKVIPNAELATKLMVRVQKDKPIVLDKHALGLSTKLAKTKSTGSSGSTASTGTAKKKSGLISGLRGQTAAQQTCSIAAG